jgi:hypothetical protein
VSTAPITVVETAVFQRTAQRIMREPEVGGLIDFVARNPLAGDVIEGAGGLRKLRWRLAGRGKRGGARVIYYFHDAEMPLYLLLAYSKAATENVSADELRRLRLIAEEVQQRRKAKSRK